MFNLDPGKLLVIAIVAIILLGPDKLPQFARQVGGAWRSLNEFRHRMEAEVRNTMPDLPPTSELARLARSPSALLDHLSAMSTDDEQGQEPAQGPASEQGTGSERGEDEAPDGSFQPPFPADRPVHAASGNGNGNGTAAPDATRPSGDSAGDPTSTGDPTDDSTGQAPPATTTARVPTAEHAPALVSEPAPEAAPEAAPEGMVPGDPTLN